METATTTPPATTQTPAKAELSLQVVPAFLPLYELAYDRSVRHFFMWGGRGGAKSTAMADFFAVHGRNDHGTYLCTREVQNSLAESVYGSIKESIERVGIPGYYMTETSIDHTSGAHMVFAGLGYKNGQHVKSTTRIKRAWTEEAQQTSTKSLEVLIPTVRAANSKLYYTFNRLLPRDPVYDYFLSFKTRSQRASCTLPDGKRLEWRLHRGDGCIGIEINFDGNPFFPEALEEDRRRDERNATESGDWGHYNHVWRGMPQSQGDTAIITLRQAMEAARRQVADEGAVEIGADIARGGKDLVVFYKRRGLAVIDRREYANNAKSEKMRITQTAERLMAFANDDRSILIKPDDTGLGGGVTDILEDKGFNVMPINFAAKAADYDHYSNVASELWFYFAGIIDTVSIPDEIGLIEELTERREGRRDSRGRRTVEPKADFIERVGRSPDNADALLLAFYEPNNVVRSVQWVIA